MASHRTVEAILVAVNNPAAHNLPRNASGHYFYEVRVGKDEPFHHSVVKAAKRRNIEMTAVAPGVYHATRTHWVRLRQELTPGEFERIPSFQSTVAPAELTELARFIFEHMSDCSQKIRIEFADGPHREMQVPPIRLNQSSADYWNQLGEQLAAEPGWSKLSIDRSRKYAVPVKPLPDIVLLQGRTAPSKYDFLQSW